jgi:hypothetical protein
MKKNTLEKIGELFIHRIGVQTLKDDVLAGALTVVGEELISEYSTNQITNQITTMNIILGDGDVNQAKKIMKDIIDDLLIKLTHEYMAEYIKM